MVTLADKRTERVSATNVHFIDNLLCVSLNNGRNISVAIDHVSWLDWLAKASPTQRTKWSLEPGGFAIYWDELDDGIELHHLLRMSPA